MEQPPRGRLNAFDWLHALLALGVVAWLNVGMSSALMSQVPSYVRWGAFAAWFCLSMLHDRAFGRVFIGQCWPLLLLMLYMLLVQAFGAQDLEPYQYGVGYLLVVYSLFVYYLRPEYRPVQVMLFLYLAVDTAVVGFNTYIALGDNPLLARYLATSSVTRDTLLEGRVFSGIGGYGYAYTLGVLALVFGFLLLNRARKRLLLAALLAVSLLLLVRASFAIGIILAVLLLITVTILRLFKASGRFVPVLIALAVSGLFVVSSGPVLTYLAQIPGLPPTVATRFAEMTIGFGGGDLNGTDFRGRIFYYGESMTAFVNNLFFGTSANPEGNLGPGGHATWLDLLAVFGLFAVAVFVFLVRAYRLTLERLGPAAGPLVNVFWLYFLILGCVNTLLFANVLLTWFLFLPLFIELFREAFSRPAPEPIDVPAMGSGDTVSSGVRRE